MEVKRPATLRVGQHELPLPVYFPSISSVKTALRPNDYLQVLSSLVGLNSQFLVSAFDLATIDNSEQVVQMLRTANEAGAVTLMDSGNYESFWKDAQVSWTQTAFHNVLDTFSFDLAFGFDEQHPPEDFSEHVALVVARWRADQEAAGNCLIVPIVHGTADALPTLCAAVVAETGVSMIAVPERRLGDGVISRARAVEAIRSELNKQGRYVALHLLGTGNPISIALYTEMGADSFDGLEWCQTVVDHDTALLFHLSHADFFAGQTPWADTELSFHASTLAHNLEFYSEWMRRLRQAASNGTVVDFCRYNVPDRVFRQCALNFGWK
ncbi:MAG: tRNA guanosine transglycosylase family protein [Sulfuricella sp.]